MAYRSRRAPRIARSRSGLIVCALGAALSGLGLSLIVYALATPGGCTDARLGLLCVVYFGAQLAAFTLAGFALAFAQMDANQ